MLRCECEGPFISTSGGKVACSGLTPIEEVPFPNGDGSRDAPAGVWRRFAARDPALDAVVGKDPLGRMETLLYWDVVGYAAAVKVDDEYFCPDAHEDVRYELGVTLLHEALPGGAGGMLVAESLQAAMKRLRALKNRADIPRHATLVVLRCACGGPFVIYPSGTVACSKLTPIGEVSLNCAQDGLHGARARAPHGARPTSAPAHRLRQVRRPSLPRPQRPGRQVSRGHPVSCRVAAQGQDCIGAAWEATRLAKNHERFLAR